MDLPSGLTNTVTGLEIEDLLAEVNMVPWRVCESALDIKGLGIVKVVTDLVKLGTLAPLRFRILDAEELPSSDGFESLFLAPGRLRMLGRTGSRLGTLTTGGGAGSFSSLLGTLLAASSWLYFSNSLARLLRGVCCDTREDRSVPSSNCLVRIIGRKTRSESVPRKISQEWNAIKIQAETLSHILFKGDFFPSPVKKTKTN